MKKSCAVVLFLLLVFSPWSARAAVTSDLLSDYTFSGNGDDESAADFALVPGADALSAGSTVETMSLAAEGSTQYKISLKKGSNLISLPLQPADTSITAVTSSISGMFTTIWTKQGGKRISYNPASSKVQTLSTMEVGKGYWINMSQNAVLTITGSPPTGGLTLAAGWNLAGYNATLSLPMDWALKNIKADVEIIIGFGDGAPKIYIPRKNGTDSPTGGLMLQSMEPGRGYLIKTRQQTNWKIEGIQTISGKTGGTITTPDGASVTFPDNYTTGNVSVLFSPTETPVAAKGAIYEPVSPSYFLSVGAGATDWGSFVVTLPVDPAKLPQGDEQAVQAQLMAGYFYGAKKDQAPASKMAIYSAAAKTVTFTLALDKLTQAVTTSTQNAFVQSRVLDEFGAGASIEELDQSTQAVETRTQKNSVYPLLTPEAARDGSILAVTKVAEPVLADPYLSKNGSFRIHYYAKPWGYAPKSDFLWGSTTKTATDFKVPDYIEDMGTALDECFAKLTTIPQDSNGALLFDPANISVPLEVYVQDLGGDAGESPLGGPMKVDCKRMASMTDMRDTASHELVHVLQGKYYPSSITQTTGKLFAGLKDRWFVEAAATFYAANIWGYDQTKKQEMYAESMTNYLGVSLTASSDGSMYSAAHFLEWLADPAQNSDTQKYHNASTVENTYMHHYAFSDLSALSSEITANGGDIGTAFKDYIIYITTHPDDFGGFPDKAKQKISAVTKDFLSPQGAAFFSDIRTNRRLFVQLSQLGFPSLACRNITLAAKNTKPGLLVIDPSKSQFYTPLVHSLIYDFIAKGNSDYEGMKPIDADNPLSEKKVLTIKNFGRTSEKKGVEQTIINSYMYSSGADIRINYYLLLEPKIISVKRTATGGEITWDVSDIGTRGGIPSEYIKGFYIFDSSGNQINPGVITPPADDPTATNIEISYASPDIDSNKTDDYYIVIEDIYGNRWPEGPPNTPGKPKKVYVNIGAQFSSTGPKTDCSGKAFGPLAPTFESLRWLGNNFSGNIFLTGSAGTVPVGSIKGKMSNDSKTILSLDISIILFNVKISLKNIPQIPSTSEYNVVGDEALQSLVSFHATFNGCDFTTVKTMTAIQVIFQDL